MAIPGKRITALAAVIALTGAEIVPVVQSGEAKSATVAQLRASAGWVSLADYPTLQAACAASKCVYVPYGTWEFPIGWVIPEGLYIWGPGVLKLATTTGLPAGITWAIDGTASNWCIDVRELDGNRAGMSGTSGFRVHGIKLRGSADVDFQPRICRGWHNVGLDLTSATQADPTDPSTPPTPPVDVVRRTRIHDVLFLDCGIEADTSGFGYSDSKVVQIGSTTSGVSVYNLTLYNCTGGGVVAAAYNDDLQIHDITGVNENPSAARTYASDLVAVEQLSRNCSVGNIAGRGYKQLANIESVLGGVLGDFYASDVENGVNVFSSNINAVLTDGGKLIIGDVNVTCRSTSAGTFGVRVVKGGGNSCTDVTLGTIQTMGGEFGIQLSGINRGSAQALTARGAGNGINIAACVDFQVDSWHALGNVNEGLYCGPGNNRVTIRGGQSAGNGTYGVDVAAGQILLNILDNDLDGGNGIADFRINAYDAGNGVFHRRNKYRTSSTTARTFSGATPDVRFSGPVSYFDNTAGAVTITNLLNGVHGESYLFRCIDAGGLSTVQHGANIATNTGANITLANKRAVLAVLAPDGLWSVI